MHKLCELIRLLYVLQAVWIPANANSFLSETLVRKDQVQSVLEHQPVDVSECENPKVRPMFMSLLSSLTCSQAYGPDRYHLVRL